MKKMLAHSNSSQLEDVHCPSTPHFCVLVLEHLRTAIFLRPDCCGETLVTTWYSPAFCSRGHGEVTCILNRTLHGMCHCSDGARHTVKLVSCHQSTCTRDSCMCKPEGVDRRFWAKLRPLQAVSAPDGWNGRISLLGISLIPQKRTIPPSRLEPAVTLLNSF
jgi:hypothetical protein